MGTVNYMTSDYITMGIRPYDYCDFETNSEVIEAAQEQGIELQDYIEDMISEYYSCDMANAEAILDRYSFYYYYIKLEPGYYEGLSLSIENNYPCCYDSWEDRRDANKEITQIKKMLIELAGCGFVSCAPGWCTGYEDYKGTLAEINSAIKEMREEVKATPTWAQYER